MVPTASLFLLIAAFFGAGLVNAIGSPSTQLSFIRWGYPGWWCRVTGASEIIVAVLIAISITRLAGLIFGTVIIAAALVTVSRHREWAHLAPLGLFVTLLALNGLAY